MTPLIFEAWYYEGFGYGAVRKVNAIVTANTREEGLGLLLERYQDTKAMYWTMALIDLSPIGVYHISEDN